MKYLPLLIIILFLGACAHTNLRVKTHETIHQGVIIQSLIFKKNNKQKIIVCYSEILNQKLIGLSCQNDTGLPLFSGGLKENEFELEKVSRFIFNIKPKTVLNYIKISLFSEYFIEKKPKYSIKINKNNDETLIHDYELKLTVSLVVLS